MTRRANILAYHAIGPCRRGEDANNLFVRPDAFEHQMTFLARRRRVVRLDELMAGLDGPAVAITFDDAYAALIEHALPVLERFRFPATIFVPTAWIGRDAGWLPTSSCDHRVMTEGELRRAADAGFSVQSHGDRHARMSTLSDETARADVAASTERLAAITGQRPRYFAYPYGDVSRAVASIVRDSGYAAAFSIDRPGRYRYAFERTQVTPLDGRALFAIKASGRYLSWRNSAAIRASYGAVKPLLRPVLDRRR